MFSKFSSKLVLIVFVVITTGFYFGSAQSANAQLPIEAGLGQACTRSVNCVDVDENSIINEIDCGAPENADCSLCKENIQCSSHLRCGLSGKCIQCEDDTNCTDALGESCTSGVCTLPGGNNAGDLCADNGNCKSGLKCGARGICEEAPAGVPVGCVDIDENSVINEIDCGAPENAQCTVCGGPGDGPGGDAKPTDGGGGEWDWTGIDLSIQDVADIINGLACWLTRIATAIMVIFLVIAGMRFMYARGEPAKYESAKKNFQHVLIGILVIMAVYVIIATVANAVGRTDFSLIPLIC